MLILLHANMEQAVMRAMMDLVMTFEAAVRKIVAHASSSMSQ